MASDDLAHVLAGLAGLGERGAEVSRLTLRVGVINSIDPGGTVTVRVGDAVDPDDVPAFYPQLTTMGSVSVGDLVYWLQDFSGIGVVLGQAIPSAAAAGASSIGINAVLFGGKPPDYYLAVDDLREQAQPIREVTAPYTLIPDDVGRMIIATTTGTIYVPADLDLAPGQYIDITTIAGTTTIVGMVGTVVNGYLNLTAAYSYLRMFCRATDSYMMLRNP